MNFQKTSYQHATPTGIRESVPSKRDRIDAWFKRKSPDPVTCVFPSDQLLRHRRSIVEEIARLDAQIQNLARMCSQIDRLSACARPS
jgi:hypothetical protein